MHTVTRRVPTACAKAILCVKQVAHVDSGGRESNTVNHSSGYQCVLHAVEAHCPPPLRTAMRAKPVPLQAGFALSRLAATEALHVLYPSRDELFTGQRGDAIAAWNAELSLSHEDTIAAAVAWPHTAAHTQHRGDACCSNVPTAPGDLCNSGSAPSLQYAVDIGDVTRVRQLYTRFPAFHARWLPQCHLEGDGQPTLENARILAQHWSVRECCVKLLGIPNRSFAYECIQTVRLAERGLPLGALPLPCGGLRDESVYLAVITGPEAEAFALHGLAPVISVQTWCLRDQTTLRAFHDRQYAVTVAWCLRAAPRA